jgi:cytochrome c oxidase subunit 3
MATLTEPHVGSPPPLDPGKATGGGGGDESGRPERPKQSSHAVVGIVILMIASMMTFSAMFCALIVRRGMSNDWRRFPLPSILWWNTGILLLSSVAIEFARHYLRRNRRSAFNLLWTAGTALGTWFLIGQIIAWTQLDARGLYLFGNPSSAFFYVLTWAHAAHVVGALAAVYYVDFRGLRYELGPDRRGWVNASSLFWHFLDVLWLGIMGLFAFWA